MEAYGKLLKKDLSETRWSLLIMTGISFVWQLYLASGRHNMPPAMVFGLGFLPLGFLPLWLLWSGMQGLRSEFNQDTAFLLLALPVSGWKIISSKLVAMLINFLVLLTVIIGGGLLLLGSALPIIMGEAYFLITPGWLVNNGLVGLTYSLVVALLLLVITQFSYIASRMVLRFQAFVAIWVFFVATWLVSRISELVQPVLAWLPPMPVSTLSQVQGMYYTSYVLVPTAPLVGVLIATLVLFALGAYLFEYQIEV